MAENLIKLVGGKKPIHWQGHGDFSRRQKFKPLPNLWGLFIRMSGHGPWRTGSPEIFVLGILCENEREYLRSDLKDVAVYESSIDGIVGCDENDTVVIYNHNMEQLLG